MKITLGSEQVFLKLDSHEKPVDGFGGKLPGLPYLERNDMIALKTNSSFREFVFYSLKRLWHIFAV